MVVVDVLLVSPKTCGNVGFVARCMANFALGKLAIVNPRYTIDGSLKGYAMHGYFKVEGANVVENVADTPGFIGELGRNYELVIGTVGKIASRKHLARVPVTPGQAARMVHPGERVLLVFGREDTGLTNGEIERCDVIITIPTAPAYPSMNISHAAAIVFHEFFKVLGNPMDGRNKDGQNRGFEDFRDKDVIPASRDLRKRFVSAFMDSLPRSKNEADQLRINLFVQVLENILDRSRVTGRELRVIAGFLHLPFRDG